MHLIRHRETPQRRGIAALWARTVAGMCALVLAVGAVGVAVTAVQQSALRGLAAQLRTEVEAVSSLALAINEADVPMAVVFYDLEGQGAREDAADALARVDERVRAAFADLDALLPSDAGAAPLAAAEEDWAFVVRQIARAERRWGTGEVSAALAAGTDPFAEAWQRRASAQTRLDQILAGSVVRAEASGHRAEALVHWLWAGLALALASSVALALLGARRLRRQVIAPLLAAASTAERMQAGDLSARVPSFGSGDEIGRLAGAVNDLATWLEASHGRLRAQATSDPLTGLPNRRALQDVLERRVRQQHGHGLALLFIDLDDFKHVNDSAGHAAGDALLRAVADRLLEATRPTDTVVRIGGDEFAIVVEGEGRPPVERATRVAERILASLAEPVELEHGPITTGCSIGIAEGVPGRWDVTELQRNADVAMYTAKGRGKGCTEVFAQDMHARLLAGLELKRDLATAAARDELVLHYQPVHDLEDGTVLGLEALVRWHHPSRGLLAPDDFIPLAEATGDVVALGDWVLERACADLADLLATGAAPAGTWVSVNVSGRQVTDPGFAASVEAALLRHDLPAGGLVLEITETVLVGDAGRTATSLAPLRAAGVRIALDDFGTGYSSLRYLQELPVDMLKIDRSFTAGTDVGDRPRVLDAIVGMGQALGLCMVVEGIERIEEVAHLRRLGGVAGQGYLFARPCPLHDLDLQPAAIAIAPRAGAGAPA